MSDKLSILPSTAITTALLSAYVASKAQDHSQCTEEKCVHEEDGDSVMELAKTLTTAVNNCPEFQMFCQRYIEEGIIQGARTGNGNQALSALAVFFVHTGWELAARYLDGQALEKKVQ